MKNAVNDKNDGNKYNSIQPSGYRKRVYSPTLDNLDSIRKEQERVNQIINDSMNNKRKNPLATMDPMMNPRRASRPETYSPSRIPSPLKRRVRSPGKISEAAPALGNMSPSNLDSHFDSFDPIPSAEGLNPNTLEPKAMDPNDPNNPNNKPLEHPSITNRSPDKRLKARSIHYATIDDDNSPDYLLPSNGGYNPKSHLYELKMYEQEGDGEVPPYDDLSGAGDESGRGILESPGAGTRFQSVGDPSEHNSIHSLPLQVPYPPVQIHDGYGGPRGPAVDYAKMLRANIRGMHKVKHTADHRFA